jgi:hypothetical protein
MKFEPTFSNLHEPTKIKIAVLAQSNNDKDAKKSLLIFSNDDRKKFKKNKMEEVKFYEWNPKVKDVLLLVNETKMVIWNINDKTEVELNFYHSQVETDDNEIVINADWNEEGEYLIATNNLNRSTIYNQNLSPRIFFDEERNDKAFILETKEHLKMNRVHFYVFICGKVVGSNKYEYGLYRLKAQINHNKDNNIKTSVSKTKYHTIDNFYNNNSIIFNYDAFNQVIYLAKKGQNIIHCIKYSKIKHSLQIFKTIDQQLERINNIYFFPLSFLVQTEKEIGRYDF